jgi:tryptophan-rich sensory protein
MNLRRIVELVWLAVAAFAAIEAVMAYRYQKWSEMQLFIFVFVVAIVFYFLRRYQRLKRG